MLYKQMVQEKLGNLNKSYRFDDSLLISWYTYLYCNCESAHLGKLGNGTQDLSCFISYNCIESRLI